MAGSIKKPKATPTPNPCGLTTREVEIAVLAWKALGDDGKASLNPTTPSTPQMTSTHAHSNEPISSIQPQEEEDHHHDAPRKRKSNVTDSSLASQPKQIDNQKLAELAKIGKAESARRMWSTIKTKITTATMPSNDSAGPVTPAAPATPDGATVLGATDPVSPSVIASEKKIAGKKIAGKVAGRKRTMKEAGDGDDDETGGINDEADGGERPKKAAKHVNSGRIVTLKEDPTVVSGEAKAEEAGEV